MSWADAKELFHILTTVVVALVILGRWLEARAGGEKATAKEVAALQAAIAAKADKDDLELVVERLRREMVEAERRAKHESVNETNAEIGKLWSHKVDTKLHDSQIEELKRRITNCERASGIGNGRGVAGV